MARMFPPSLEDVKPESRVEPELFKLFADNLDNEYTVLYGVSWYLPNSEAQHTGNNGEADFVIIHPKKGIIVIEAKTGKLKYSPNTGKWEIEGSSQRKKESPLRQAEKNRYALEKGLNKAFKDSPQKPPKIKFCFAVALPHCNYDPVFEPVGLPKSLFLDSEACVDVSAWVDGVFSFYSGNQSQSLDDWVDAIVEVLVGSNKFSSTLKSQMALMLKTIDSLTTEQYQIIDWLRNNNRAKIAGCAGSGKTLVAVEKAIRLSRLGNCTLLLCHSYYLAKNLRFLTKDTDIHVEDFCSWIERLTGKITSEADNWNHYEEPTDDELFTAHIHLLDSSERYDAIIVDEGQDFRDNWWEIVEDALKNKADGILYIFCDDNQTLLPRRTKYPITEAPFPLSKNCRNAGKVFEVVKRFHPQAPEPSIYLQKAGIVKCGKLDFAVIDALQHHVLYAEQLVVLTTEPEPVEQSFLNGYEVVFPPLWKWQDVVREHLATIATQTNRFSTIDKPNLPHFSPSILPNQEDIFKVFEFTQQVIFNLRHLDSHLAEIHHYKSKIPMKWRDMGDNLFLFGRTHSVYALLAFFSSEEWAKDIPQPRKVCISANRESTDIEQIQLSTVASFKGLESDGVILCIDSYRDNLESNLYVGVSRAKFVLYVVGYNKLLSNLSDIETTE
ncbi:MAG: NERD domain-containing protein [Nostocaceae cyanobacterium]|nr:NERD domain-containing protein [Nostocaceae cyanobacterium]